MSAATQRFKTGFDRAWVVSYEQYMREEVAQRRREWIEIADTGAAGTVNTIRHSLGRVPVGAVIVRTVNTNVELPYNDPSDPDWTKTEINLRFVNSNSRVLLEVF